MTVPINPEGEIKRGSRARLSQFLHSLARPSAAVTNLVERRQARFHATITLVFACLTGVGVVVRVISGSFFESPLRGIISVIATLGLFGAYGLSRTRHYRYAPLVALTVLVGFIYAAFFLSEGDSNTALLWLAPIIILAGTMLSLRDASIFALTNIIFVIVAPFVVPGVTFATVGSASGLLIVTAALILTTSQYRDRLENERQQELTTANQELQVLSHSLEDRVRERTRDLALATEVGRVISQIHNLDDLLTQAVNLIRDRFNLHYTQIYLTDLETQQLILRAGTGQAGQELLSRNHALLLDENSINGTAVVRQEAIIVPDVHKSPIFRPNPVLPDIRSEMSVPLVIRDQVVGVIDLQSEELHALSEDNLPAFSALAGQLAIAIENASLFHNQEQLTAQMTETTLFLDSIVANIPSILFVKETEDLRYVRVSRGMEELVGLPAADIEGKNHYDFFPEETAAAFAAQDYEVIAGRKVVDISEERVEGVDGVYYLHTMKAPVMGADGNPKYLIGISQDITERKQMEQQLSERLKQLNLLNEIGRKAEELSDLDEFMCWVMERVPQAMAHAESCVGAITLDGKVYGDAQAIDLPRHIVEDLRIRGELVGRIIVAYTEETLDFRDEDSALIGSVGRRIGGYIENQRLLRRLQMQAESLQKVAEISTAVATTRNPFRLAQEVAELTRSQFALYQTAVFTLQEDDLVLAGASGVVDAQLVSQGLRFPLKTSKTLLARAARSQQGILVNDVTTEPDFLSHPLLPDTRAEIVVPLIVGKQVLGVLDIQSTQKDSFTDEDLNIYTTLASQVAVALQNARQYQQTQEALEELSSLQRVITGESWETFMTAHERSIQGYLATHQAVHPLGSNRADSKPANGDTPIPVQEVMNKTDHTYAAPVQVRGITIGKLGIRGKADAPISPENEAILDAISQQVAEALERARLFEETELARAQTDQLYAGSERVVRANTIDEVLLALIETTKLKEMDRANLLFFDRPWDHEPPTSMVVAAVWETSDKPSPGPVGTVYSLAQYPIGRFLSRHEPFVVNNVGTESRIDDTTRQLFTGRLGMHSALVFPLLAGDRWIGIITGQASTTRDFNANDIRQISSLVDQAAAVVQTQRLFEASQARARQLAAINQVAEAVAQQVETTHLLEAVYEQVSYIIAMDAFHIALYRADTAEMDYPLIVEDGQRIEPFTKPLSPSSHSHKVIHTGERVLVHLTPAEAQAIQEQQPDFLIGDKANRITASMIFVPLQAGQQVIGVLSAQSYQFDVFTQEDVDLLSGIASYVAVGLENSRLFTQTQERAEELAVINQVAQAVSQQLNIEQVLETVHHQVSQVMVVDAFSVSRYDSATNIVEYLYIYDSGEQHEQESAPLDESSQSYRVISTKQPVINNHTPEEHEALVAAQTAPLVGKAQLPPSTIFAPLMVGTQPIGVLSVQSYDYNAYTENDLGLLMGIANHMAVALENARLFAQTQDALAETEKRTEELALVNQVVTQLSSSLDIHHAMDMVARGLVTGTGVDQVRIALIDTQKQMLTIVAEQFDSKKSTSALGVQIPLEGNHLTQQVIRTRQPVVIADALHHPLTEPVRDLFAQQGIQALAILPMMVGNEVIGTVGMDLLTEGDAISEGALHLAETIIFQAATAIQNARLFAQTEAALQEVQVLLDVSERLNAATTFEEIVLAASAPALADEADEGTMFVFELDAAGEPEWARSAATTNPEPLLPVGTRLYLPHMPFAHLWLSAREGVLLVENVDRDERVDPDSRAVFAQTQTKAFVIMTLTVGNRLLGGISIRWTEPHVFTERDRRLYSSIAAQTAAVVDSILLINEVQTRATELQETTGFLDSVIENLPVMLFVKDAEDLRVIRWNKAGSDIVGQPQETFLGKTDYDFYPKEKAEFFITKDREVLKNGVPVEIPDEPIQTAHQGVRTLHTRKVPIVDAAGNPKYLLGISEDITERRQFEEALAKRALELQTVAGISTAVASTLDASQLLQDVVDLTRDKFGLYHAHIYLMNEARDALELAAGAGEAGAQMVAEGRTIPLDSQQSLVARAARSRRGVIVNDVLADDGFLPNALLPYTRAEMAVPLILGNEVIGVLDVQSDEADHFTTQDINIQATLASQVATALQNARLFTQTEARAAELATINAMTEVASSQLNLAGLVERVGPLLQKTFHTETAYIALYDNISQVISFPYYHSHEDGLVTQAPRRVDENSGFTGQIIQSRQPILFIPDPGSFTEEAAEKGGRITGSGGETPSSYLGVPIIVGEAVVGVIGLNSHGDMHIFDAADQRLLTTLASTIGVAIQNAQQFDAIRRRAERERIVNEITQKIQGSLSMESALQTAVKELGQALSAKYTQVELKLGKEAAAQAPNGGNKKRQKAG